LGHGGRWRQPNSGKRLTGERRGGAELVLGLTHGRFVAGVGVGATLEMACGGGCWSFGSGEFPA
jgi:hypothetical protein